MASFADYDDYSPGEVYRGAYGPLSPQQRLDYNQEKKRVFKSAPTGDLFQRFLALQNNPEALFTATARMPDTPFGNLSQYMGVKPPIINGRQT
jgi:hypothetical protein